MFSLRRPLTALILPLATLATLPPLVAQEVVFHRRSAQPGDTSQQQLNCDLDLTMSIRQAGQVVQAQKQLLQRQQQRELTILQATPQTPQQGRVTYDKSVVTLKSADQPPQSSDQPVTGKSYLVTRQADKLSITYPDGSQPPEMERVIVAENMETFGLPNPIASFFDGRTVRVGQTMKLPAELARDLLGFAEAGNSVSNFGLKLIELRPAAPGGASAVAVFEIGLKANDPQKSGITMTLSGQMELEVETCRALSVRLSGPVVASEIHGPPAGQYELHSEGQIAVTVQASYLRSVAARRVSTRQ